MERSERWVGVLGPTVAGTGGVDRQVTAPRQRAVLARLALNPGRPVSADQLLSDVWGDDLPKNGPSAVAFQISKLRDTLEPDRQGEGTLISTSSAGYELSVAAEDVDAFEFKRLIAEARALLGEDPATAKMRVEQAVSLWRGEPFADVVDVPFVDDEGRQLAAQKLLAAQTLIEARMALGEHTVLVPELEQLVREHPFEEALVKTLMTCLDRAGRTADALRAFDSLRVRLGEELGIEPSREIRALEEGLLLGTNPADAPQTPAPEAGPKPRRMQRARSSASSFVGREADIAQVLELLDSARLVTLCGFGGLGKTRLAEQVALRVGASTSGGGVWFVDLTGISEADVLADTFIAAGDAGGPPDSDPVDYLLVQLAQRDVLVVVDNCEELLEDVADLVHEILVSAPGVRVLATSRASLGVEGEAIVPIQPLQPDSAQELFFDRGRLAHPGLTSRSSDRAAAQVVCERLDGIPLAIELAAARLSVMGISQIAQHLDDHVQILGGERRRGDDNRSLDAVMAWSYGLLGDVPQKLLRAFSLFPGGLTVDTALEVGAGQEPAVSPADVLDSLGQLAEASLVIRQDTGSEARYRMLEPVRDFASGKLNDAEADHAAHVQATLMAGIAAQLRELGSGEHSAMLALGERELANGRAAMTWSFANDHPRLGLSIILGIRDYMWSQMMHRELLRWLVIGLEANEDDSVEAINASTIAVNEAVNVADWDAQVYAMSRVERVLESDGFAGLEPDLQARLLSARGSGALVVDPRVCEACCAEALHLPSLDTRIVMALLNNLLEASWMTGSLAEARTARARVEGARAAPTETPPLAFKVEAGLAARSARWQDVVDIADNAPPLEPALEISIGILLAEAYGSLGRFEEGITLLDELDIEAITYYENTALVVRAMIHLASGDTAAAVAVLREMVQRVTDDGRPLAIRANITALLAVAAQNLGEAETAAQFLGYGDAEMARLDLALRPSDQPLVHPARQACEQSLGAAQFNRLLNLGAATDWAGLPQL